MDNIKSVEAAGVPQISKTQVAKTIPDVEGVKEPSKRIFLGVGINDFESIGDLQFCVKDAEDMKSTLEGNPLWQDADIQLHLDQEATKDGIRSGISQYDGQLTNKDTFMFYFSGHGTNWRGKSYLCPQDTDPKNQDSLITPEELADWLKNLAKDPEKPPKIVVSLDSCFSGGFAKIKSLYPGSKFGVRFAPMEESEDYPEDDFAEILAEELYDPMKGTKAAEGTKQIKSLSNVEVYAASKPSEPSLELPELQNGLYTHFWVEGAGYGSEFGPADTDNDSKMSASEIYEYAKPKVEAYGDRQHPVKKDNYKGEIWLKAKEDIFPGKKSNLRLQPENGVRHRNST